MGLTGKAAETAPALVRGYSLLMMPMATAIRIAVFATSAGLLFGVDLGSMGGAMNQMQAHLELSTIEVEAVVSGAKGGAIFGCLLGGALMQRYGRRNAVVLALVPFFVGPLIIGFASNFVEAMIGRLLVGLGIGIASVATPCFLSEISPASVRGAVVSLYELAIALGFFVASIINLEIQVLTGASEATWRYQAGLLPFVSAFPLLIACTLVPESPRWLLSYAGGDVEKLRGVLRAMTRLSLPGADERLASAAAAAQGEPVVPEVRDDARSDCGSSGSHDVLGLFDAHHAKVGSPLFLSAAEVAERDAEVAAPVEKSSALWILWDTLKDIGAVIVQAPRVPEGTRHGMLLAMAAAILTQACASTSVLIYTQHLLRDVGVGSLAVQDTLALGVGFAKLAGVAIGICIVNKVGRKPLLGWGGASCATMLTFLAVGNALRAVDLMMVGMCGFILVYCVTWASGYWVVATEVTAVGGVKFGAACQAAATAVMFTAGWATSFTFASVTQAGPWALLTYAGVAVLMALYSLALPEMRGQTLEGCAELVRARTRPASCGSDSDASVSQSTA